MSLSPVCHSVSLIKSSEMLSHSQLHCVLVNRHRYSLFVGESSIPHPYAPPSPLIIFLIPPLGVVTTRWGLGSDTLHSPFNSTPAAPK